MTKRVVLYALFASSLLACKTKGGVGVSTPAFADSEQSEACEPACNWPLANGTVVDQHDYLLSPVPADTIERFQPIATATSPLPETVHGLWWMNGNPLADRTVTFANAIYDQKNRKALVPVYGAGNYSWLGDTSGANLYNFSRTINLVYDVQFSEDSKVATIVPTVRFLGRQIAIPHFLAKFTMHYVGDGRWNRETWFLGHRAPDYTLQRIVKADGNRDPEYANYLKTIPQGLPLYLPKHK